MESIISNDIHKAIKLLENDEVVAIPTETVYGLAGNIYSEKAIKKIFETKQRPSFNPLIVHISSIDKLDEIVSYVPEKARVLASTFWPGSLTLVLPKKSTIPNTITAGKETVGVRVPKHPITLELLSKLNFPLAAPSANPFNRISPTKAIHVAHYFDGKIQMVLEGGTCTNGLESTIIGFDNDEPIVYRLGAIALETIEKVIGKVTIKNKEEHQPDAPGMLAKHYAPKTKTILSNTLLSDINLYKHLKVGLITFFNQQEFNVEKHIVLSKNKNLDEAASHLYDALHQLDTLQLDIIIAEKLPDTGLGKAMNDRLERASS